MQLTEAARKLYLKILLFSDFLIRTFTSKNRWHGIKKILFVRIDSLGDFILWLDAAKDLRRLYPSSNHQITLICNAAWADLAQELPYWDHVIPLIRREFVRNPIYRWGFLIKLIRMGFDITVNPTYSREFYCGDSIVYASKAANRIGSTGELTNITAKLKRQSDVWYTHLIPAAKDEPLMELERNAEFMRGLGLNSFRSSVPVLTNVAPLPERLKIENPYYVVSPGAGWAKKLWPIHNFVETARLIHNKTNLIGLICGGPNEKSLGAQLASQSGGILRNITGETTTLELISIIKNARFVLGNDSGPIHIAAAVSTPSVCIVDGTDPGRFFPYKIENPVSGAVFPIPVINQMDCFGCHRHCIYHLKEGAAYPCVEGVGTSAAWEAVQKILN